MVAILQLKPTIDNRKNFKLAQTATHNMLNYSDAYEVCSSMYLLHNCLWLINSSKCVQSKQTRKCEPRAFTSLLINLIKIQPLIVSTSYFKWYTGNKGRLLELEKKIIIVGQKESNTWRKSYSQLTFILKYGVITLCCFAFVWSHICFWIRRSWMLQEMENIST